MSDSRFSSTIHVHLIPEKQNPSPIAPLCRDIRGQRSDLELRGIQQLRCSPCHGIEDFKFMVKHYILLLFPIIASLTGVSYFGADVELVVSNSEIKLLNIISNF